MTIRIEESGRRARREVVVALALWCVGVVAGCAYGGAATVDGPTDPPPSNEPTGFGTADCVPYTCEYLDSVLPGGVECGRPGDGCGGEPLDCGDCADGSTCDVTSEPYGSRCVPVPTGDVTPERAAFSTTR